MTRSFTHKADAEAWGRKIERDIDIGGIGSDHRLKALTVGELLLRYQAEVTPNKRGAEVEKYLSSPQVLGHS